MGGRVLLDRRAAFGCALAACLGAGWAAGPAPAEGAEGDPQPVRQEHAEGPVQVTLEADRQTMPIDGNLRLSLVVDAPAHTIVTLPEVSDRLGPFVVANQTAAGPVGDGGDREQWRRDYILEVEEVGQLTVPALAVGFQEQVDQPAGARQLETEPFEITVTSVLPEDVDMTEPRDIAPPVELPPATPTWLPWLIGAVVLGLAALAVLLWRRRRRSGAARPELRPAHLLALAELERLERALPRDRPGPEEAYVRLAAILRHYVVGRFGLRAPTQTTEELLASVDRSGGPIALRRQLIGRVLGQCDLVKFARRQPGLGHAQTCLRQARDFVEQTADDQALVPEPAAAGSS